jgi:hypothetical protein
MRMARNPLSRIARLHPRSRLVLGQEIGLSNGLHNSPFIGSRRIKAASASIPNPSAHFPLSSFSS